LLPICDRASTGRWIAPPRLYFKWTTVGQFRTAGGLVLLSGGDAEASDVPAAPIRFLARPIDIFTHAAVGDILSVVLWKNILL
jgi:hypothetical protein